MRRLRSWVMRAAGMFGSGRRDRDLADEIESHIEMHTEDNIRRGMTSEAARRAAVLKLGNPVTLKEGQRERRRVPLLDDLGQDLRYAGRTLRRSPGFLVVALVTIALGVAGPAVTFTMIKAWILDPLPFSRPDDLVDLRTLDKVSGDVSSVNPADFLDWQRAAGSFESLAGYRASSVRLTEGDRAERVRGAETTANFFRLLGVQAASGRVFDIGDGRLGSEHLAVISHAMWRDRFAADPALVGRTIRMQGEDHTVIGVLPDGFQFTLLGRVEVWRLMVFTPADEANRRPRAMVGLGRLRRGRTLEQARGELAGISDRLAAAYPETNARRGVRVLSLADEVRVHHDAGFIVPVLFAMVTCVLLVACVNVSNVMLARASTRRQEMAVRLALGASRARIVRQWLVEHVVLFVAASGIGAALAVYGADWITSAIPQENRQFLRNNAVLPVDWTVLAFTLAVGAGCGLLFGWLPAWTGAAHDVNADLRDAAGRTSTGRTGTRVRAALVVGEVALALALLISAALLVETGRNLSRADVGFEPRNLVAFQLSLDPQQYRTPEVIRGFYERLTADLAGRPEAADAAAGSLVPFGTEGLGAELFFDGQPDPKPADTPGTALNEITARYGETLGLRLRRGRLLTATDDSGAPKVALINDTLASRYFRGRDPIGQRLRLGRTSPDRWTVVGVVADVKNFEITDATESQVYVPLAQRPRRQMTVIARATGDPGGLAGTIRAAVAAIDPAEPVDELMTMDARIHRVTGPFEVMSTFVTFFGALTLLLAGVGVYGVVSYSFAQRTREIGIRMALGAQRADVAALVMRQVGMFLFGALVPGLLLGWTLGNAMRAILYGVTLSDWRLYLAMSLLLSAVAVLAALVPARRATAIHPMTALRDQ